MKKTDILTLTVSGLDKVIYLLDRVAGKLESLESKIQSRIKPAKKQQTIVAAPNELPSFDVFNLLFQQRFREGYVQIEGPGGLYAVTSHELYELVKRVRADKNLYATHGTKYDQILDTVLFGSNPIRN